jgi:hypothetical protein
MFQGLDILAARGTNITDWMDLLVPVVLVGIYVINWLVSKTTEAVEKDPTQTEPEDDAEISDDLPKPPPRPLKTSPLNRAVPLKRQQPTLSNTLGHIAGQIANQANPQAPRPVNPPTQPAPVARRMPLPQRQVPQPRPQLARASSASSGHVAFSQLRPQTSQVAHAAQRQAPIPHAQPRSQSVAAAAKQPPRPAPAQPATKPPAAAQHPAASQQHKPEPPAAAPDPVHFLGSFLGDRSNIRHAIILSEILARPVSLRHDGPDPY